MSIYFIEVEKMTVSSAQFEAKERMAYDGLDEYGPAEENTVELEQQDLPSDTGEDNIIIIEENECLAFGIRFKPNVVL